MNEFDKAFYKLDFFSRYDNSIRNLSNWVLGIAVGLFTITLLNLKSTLIIDSDTSDYYKIVFFITTLNLLFAGFIKHNILLRELRLSIHYSKIKKLALFEKKQLTESEYDEQLLSLTQLNTEELQRGRFIHKLVNISSIISLVNIILFGTLILIA